MSAHDHQPGHQHQAEFGAATGRDDHHHLVAGFIQWITRNTLDPSGLTAAGDRTREVDHGQAVEGSGAVVEAPGEDGVEDVAVEWSRRSGSGRGGAGGGRRWGADAAEVVEERLGVGVAWEQHLLGAGPAAVGGQRPSSKPPAPSVRTGWPARRCRLELIVDGDAVDDRVDQGGGCRRTRRRLGQGLGQRLADDAC